MGTRELNRTKMALAATIFGLVLSGCEDTMDSVDAVAIMDQYHSRNASLEPQQQTKNRSFSVAPGTRSAFMDVVGNEAGKTTLRMNLVALISEQATSFLTEAYGEESLARQTAEVPRRADTTPHHVVFEALVVEYNKERLSDFGSGIADGADGSVSGLIFDMASLGANIAFNYDSTFNLSGSAFSIGFNLFEEHSIARVLSKHFLSTISGKMATMEIAEDKTNWRYRNSVIPAATVDSGSRIVIGGLSLQTRSAISTGIPGAQKFPPLGTLLGHKAESGQNTEVMIFLTAYTWKPASKGPTQAENRLRKSKAECADKEKKKRCWRSAL